MFTTGNNKMTSIKSVITLGSLLMAGSLSATQPFYQDQQKLHDIAQAVSASRIENDIQTLVDFGTRHTLSETQSNTRGIGAARRWIKAEFESISKQCGGCLEVIEVTDTISGEKRIPNPVEVVNIIAIQRGVDKPNRMVMMSGDIDSRVSDVMDFTSDSPGANDNASGVAGVIEAARVLSNYKFNGSIVYATLSGEEQGLFGGKILAKHAQQQGWQVHGVLNNDMIGNITGINGVTDNTTARIFSEGTRVIETKEQAHKRRFTGGEVDSASRNLARYIDTMADRYIDNLDTLLVYRLDRFARGGHHRPFNDMGYAAVAWAPAPPKGVEISGAVKPSTQLKWQKNTDKTTVGYRIYWRYTSEPQWQYSRYVGNVSEATLKNVVIDNYYFGVASVNENGIESPVVFPGDVGAFEH